MKKGLTFHKPIAYNTEYLLNELLGVMNEYFDSKKIPFDSNDFTTIQEINMKLDGIRYYPTPYLFYRKKALQLQNQFASKWKEFSSYIDKSAEEGEREGLDRGKQFNEIEEQLYHLALDLHKFQEGITKGPFSADLALISPLEDKVRSAIERILLFGIQLERKNSKNMPTRKSIAKQLFLQEFSYGKSDSYLSQAFQFVTEEVQSSLMGCCIGIVISKLVDKKRDYMERVIQYLKDVEHTILVDIQLREKQLYLLKSYAESFNEASKKTHGSISAKQNEIYKMVNELINDPYQVPC